MSRVVHANCFPAEWPAADALLSDEGMVAAVAPPDLPVFAAEGGIDCELAHATSIAMTRAACDWFRIGDDDPSITSGISAGDLAGAEAAITVLMPAARAVLAMTSALDAGLEPSALVSVVPAGDGRYARLETLAADVAVATVRARLGTSVAIDRIVSSDSRNGLLCDKYAAVRDPDYLIQTGTNRKLARTITLGLTNSQAWLRRRRRPALLVLEYHPSHEFARAYGARRRRRWRLVCWPAEPHDLLAIARAGDSAVLPLAPDLSRMPPSGVGAQLQDRADDLNGTTLRVAHVDLWPIVGGPLCAMAERYGRYAAALAGWIDRELERREIRAVLVPFDSPAHARLLVRLAQIKGIPTFVINDGYKTDEIQQEGMAADVALAWSAAMRDGYFSRRPRPAVVTGNPRTERLRPLALRRRSIQRVLLGGHTFSPVDLNCRRSDSERFLRETLDGIVAAGVHVSKRVVVKLHPSDPAAYYRSIVESHPQLEVDLRRSGDVIDLFSDFDVYVTTYSTSLLEAAAVGLPIIYYRINEQRMGPPFSDDDFLAQRTASTPAELATLLADRRGLGAAAPPGWIEYYLGPRSGAVGRVLNAIEQHVDI